MELASTSAGCLDVQRSFLITGSRQMGWGTASKARKTPPALLQL